MDDKDAKAVRKRKLAVFDTINEQAILGAALADPVVRQHVVRRLSPELFLAPQHEALARALRECENRALDPTPQALAAHGEQERWGGEGYVEVLRGAAAPRRNLPRHVEVLQWDACRARLLTGAHATLTERLLDTRVTPDDVKAAARAVLQGLEGFGSRRFLHEGQALARQWLAGFAVRRAGGGFAPTGWDPVDEKLTEGMLGGRATVLAGVSGIGKSTCAYNWCLRLAELGSKQLYCAWEGGAEAALNSMVAIRSGVTLWRVTRAQLCTPEEVERVRDATVWITNRVKFLDNAFWQRRADPREKPSNERNLDLFEGYLAQAGVEVAWMDLWERMLAARDPERDVVPALYRTHTLLEEYGVHGVLLNQINLKTVEVRSDRRPTRDAVKGTGGYVEVADVLLGVHKPDATSMDWICLKQRFGPENWAVRFRYDSAHRTLAEPAEVEYDPSEQGAGDVPRPNDPVAVRPGRRKRRRQDD